MFEDQDTHTVLPETLCNAATYLARQEVAYQSIQNHSLAKKARLPLVNYSVIIARPGVLWSMLWTVAQLAQGRPK